MDLILISKEKLKIILTKDDLQELKIDVESMDYSNVSTKRVFWEILDKAKEQAGFDAEKSKLYVQVFPSCDGGCEMFVTKYSNSLTPHPDHCTKKTYRISEKSYAEDDEIVVLSFESLCKLCRRIAGEKLHLSTSLYYDASGVYILVLKRILRLPSYTSSGISARSKLPEYLCEYGTVHKLSERTAAYLDEHCKKISAGNAAEVISSI